MTERKEKEAAAAAESVALAKISQGGRNSTALLGNFRKVQLCTFNICTPNSTVIVTKVVCSLLRGNYACQTTVFLE